MNEQQDEHIVSISSIESPAENFFETYVWSELNPVLSIVFSAFIIYLCLIISTRIAGKRSFSKMSSFDFAITVSIGSILAASILNPSVKIIHGIIALLMVFGMQITLAHFRKKEAVQKLIDNKPLMLMEGETFLKENMKRALVTESDIRGKLREANVIHLSQVKAVIFESTGDISVLHSEDDRSIDDFIISDVQK